MRFSFWLGHHRIVTDGKQHYPFVPHSPANYTFVLLELYFFWVLNLLSFLNFIQALLSIMSFCVRDVFNFQLTNGEELLAILYSYSSVLCFDTYCFLRSFRLLFAFWLQILGMGSFIYKYCLPCFLSVGLLLSPPKTF